MTKLEAMTKGTESVIRHRDAALKTVRQMRQTLKAIRLMAQGMERGGVAIVYLCENTLLSDEVTMEAQSI